MKTYRNILTIAICLLVIGIGNAQEKSKKASRYKSLSERNISVDQSVPSLLEEAEAIIETNPSRALDLVEQALATSITQKSLFNEAKCYIVLGKINENQNELKLANQNYLSAYQRLAKSYANTEEYRTTLEGLGRVNYELGNFENSKQFYEQLSQTEIDENKRLEVELKLAENEVELGETPQALERVSQLEPSSTYNQSRRLQSKGRAVKARAYAKEDNFAAAEESLAPEPSVAGASDADDLDYELSEVVLEDVEADELLNIYQEQDKKEEEIALREKIAVSKTAANKPLQATKQRQAIGKVLIEQGKTSEAIEQLKQATVLADSTGSAEESASAYLALAQAYDRSGEKSSALKAYKAHSEALQRFIEEKQNQTSLREFLLRKQQGIQNLTKDLALDESSYLLDETTMELQDQQLKSQRLLIYGLLALLLLVIVGAYFIHRKAQQTKRVGQLLALKSLRSQMNPHFIFNALNSVNQFVALNDERAANKFLADFSKLMRMVLDNSQKEFITMREEREMIALYLKLEHYRFRDQFEYSFEIDSTLDLDEIEIPPMLIQPYIENAIWHGLRYKEEKGRLSVRIFQNGEGVKISIEDDGIGRFASKQLKTDNQKKKNSVGLKNTLERVSIINQVYKTNYSISISDLNTDRSGTKVEILTPSNHG
ncbi:MAG: histidine kinase [Reichenbachiella sp.]|uniref:tetratricopeptide repeat-containing sensor histidine kinase n=1 Tax=Reichenbachiella sp. TaxID=2184521 RepID=UPI002966A934|nr:histidine kinase [Reichenbachiella sp.]MDW3210704.1 histidine kinase [Reichenbachiella sp.]